MPALKFLATVFHDASGELVATSPNDDYSEANSEATSLVMDRGTSEHTAWVYKRIRASSPNKAWAVTMLDGDNITPELKIVTDCVTWKEAFNKAFPDYAENLEGVDDYLLAQGKAYSNDWGFACEVIDETKL